MAIFKTFFPEDFVTESSDKTNDLGRGHLSERSWPAQVVVQAATVAHYLYPHPASLVFVFFPFWKPTRKDFANARHVAKISTSLDVPPRSWKNDRGSRALQTASRCCKHKSLSSWSITIVTVRLSQRVRMLAVYFSIFHTIQAHAEKKSTVKLARHCSGIRSWAFSASRRMVEWWWRIAVA